MAAVRKIVDNRYYARLLAAINHGQVKLGADFRYYNHLARPVADVDDIVYAAEGRGWVTLLDDGSPKVTAGGQAWLDSWQARPKAGPATPSVTPVFSGGVR